MYEFGTVIRKEKPSRSFSTQRADGERMWGQICLITSVRCKTWLGIIVFWMNSVGACVLISIKDQNKFTQKCFPTKQPLALHPKIHYAYIFDKKFSNIVKCYYNLKWQFSM